MIHSLTAPIMIPCTKYRWMKGYRKRIGPMVIIVTAIFTVSAGSRMFAAAPDGILPLETAFTLDMMEYS